MVPRHRGIVMLALVTALSGMTSCSSSSSTAGRPTIAFTTPADHARITGTRTVTVSGTLSGTVDTLSINVNGAPVVSVTHSGTGFDAMVQLGDGPNTIVAKAAGGGANATASLQLFYPFLALTTGQPASHVIGQTTFDRAATGVGPKALAMPSGDGAAVNGVLYLPDTYNNRVLGYQNVPTANDAAATFALGQTNLNSNAAGTDAGSLSHPTGVAQGAGKLVIADQGNQRVLIFDAPPTSNGPSAGVVVGQPGFGPNGSSCSPTGLNTPSGVAVTGSRLFVADTLNNRVLIWNDVPASNGTAPDIVLGQAGLSSCAANDAAQNGTDTTNATARTLDAPRDVWSDGTRIVVADSGNNRVLIWNAVPTSNFAAADVVVGQTDAVSNLPGTTQVIMNNPRSVVSNGNQLFVDDFTNNRVLIWNVMPDKNGAPANTVLGQPDFQSRGTGTSVTMLARPSGALLSDTTLFVTDEINNRVLTYEP